MPLLRFVQMVGQKGWAVEIIIFINDWADWNFIQKVLMKSNVTPNTHPRKYSWCKKLKVWFHFIIYKCAVFLGWFTIFSPIFSLSLHLFLTGLSFSLYAAISLIQYTNYRSLNVKIIVDVYLIYCHVRCGTAVI